MTAFIRAEYDGVALSFQDDGWFNAKDAAAKFGKRPNDWLALDETREYIAALNAISNTSQNGIWHKAKRGNNGGTWLHPKLAVHFARWLDAKFAVWCDMQIDMILGRKLFEADGVDEISSVGERMLLYIAAVDGMVRHRISLPVMYQAFNDVAGSSRFQSMTRHQVRRALPVAQRISNGTATDRDWRLLDSNRRARELSPPQPDLIGFSIKE
jgi:hypothetical protein